MASAGLIQKLALQAAFNTAKGSGLMGFRRLSSSVSVVVDSEMPEECASQKIWRCATDGRERKIIEERWTCHTKQQSVPHTHLSTSSKFLQADADADAAAPTAEVQEEGARVPGDLPAENPSGRKRSGLGVISPDKTQDLDLLVKNYTAPALASALRDREEVLHVAAQLLESEELDELRKLLRPFHHSNLERHRTKKRDMNLSEGFQAKHLHMIRKYLHRMPRQISRSASRRAAVLLTLCNVDGVPSILFSKRSDKVTSHKNEVCFPGGHVDEQDDNVVETCLREVREEIGIPDTTVEILGVLRCDWGEVESIVGVAVTPVVGFIDDLSLKKLKPNPDEVSNCFSVPIKSLLKRKNWVSGEYSKHVFTGGPYLIWGLTAYILDTFLKEVLMRYKIEGLRSMPITTGSSIADDKK